MDPCDLLDPIWYIVKCVEKSASILHFFKKKFLNLKLSSYSFFCLLCIGETKVLAAVYGPKAGTKKNENPEKASIEVIWKPKTGQIGEDNTTLFL